MCCYLLQTQRKAARGAAFFVLYLRDFPQDKSEMVMRRIPPAGGTIHLHGSTALADFREWLQYDFQRRSASCARVLLSQV